MTTKKTSNKKKLKDFKKDEPKRPDVRLFDYGHLVQECNKCGHRETIERDVEGGIRIMLPTSDQHEWRMVCPRCNNVLRWFFVESMKKKIKNEESDINNKGKKATTVKTKKTVKAKKSVAKKPRKTNNKIKRPSSDNKSIRNEKKE